MNFPTLFAAAVLLSPPALADGHADIESGEKNFKKCQACHVVQDGDGKVLAGKNGRSGPNLFGLIGRTAGSIEGFKYKKSIVAAGEAGLVWTEEELAKYLLNPTEYLRAYLDDKKARSGMSFKFRKEEEGADMAAYLASFGAAQ